LLKQRFCISQIVGIPIVKGYGNPAIHLIGVLLKPFNKLCQAHHPIVSGKILQVSCEVAGRYTEQLWIVVEILDAMIE